MLARRGGADEILRYAQDDREEALTNSLSGQGEKKEDRQECLPY